MSAQMLHEQVVIVTSQDQRSGYLFRGHDGLPELIVEQWVALEPFRPATLPAAWQIQALPGQEWGPLIESWVRIEMIESALAEAERDAEHEERMEKGEGDETPSVVRD